MAVKMAIKNKTLYYTRNSATENKRIATSKILNITNKGNRIMETNHTMGGSGHWQRSALSECFPSLYKDVQKIYIKISK